MQDRSEYCNRSEVNTLQSLIMKSWSRFDSGICSTSSSCKYCFIYLPKQEEGVNWSQVDVGSYQHQPLSTVFNHTCAVLCKNVLHFSFYLISFLSSACQMEEEGHSSKDSCYCPPRQSFAKCITGLTFLFFVLFVAIAFHHDQVSVLQF